MFITFDFTFIKVNYLGKTLKYIKVNIFLQIIF